MPDRQLFLKAHSTGQLVGEIVALQLRRAGLPSYLFGLLTEIRQRGPVAPSTISAATGVPMTTLRDNIQRLVDRGLVRRRPNPADGRSYLVGVTARGEAITRAADPALLEAYLALEDRLSRPLAAYERTLDELNAALRSTLESLAPEDAAAEAS